MTLVDQLKSALRKDGRALPLDDHESESIAATIRFLETDANPFDRNNFAGHLTGSAWLLSPDGGSVLLTRHAVIDRWLQLGGHAEPGETEIEEVALREAREESGIEEIEFLSREIFDVDVHRVPANPAKASPSHFHYDIRYLLQAKRSDFTITAESKALQWIPLETIFDFQLQPGMVRMARKWKDFNTNPHLTPS